jgi:hypothetical protein
MSNENRSYYAAQLARITPAGKYAPTIKIHAGDAANGRDTNHISLNAESAAVLIDWLTANYIAPAEKAKGVTADDFTRVSNDSNGNPRYVIHFLKIADDYDTALFRAKKIGGRKFNNKQYGGGIVFQSYNLDNTCEQINDLMKSL